MRELRHIPLTYVDAACYQTTSAEPRVRGSSFGHRITWLIGNLATHRHGRKHERLSDVRSPHLSVKEGHLLIPVCHLRGEVLQHPTCDRVGVKPCHDVRINQQASRPSLDRHEFPICYYKLGKQHLPSTQGIQNLLTHPHSSRHCTFFEHRNPCPTLHFKGLDEDQQNADLPSSPSFSHENSPARPRRRSALRCARLML